MPIFKQALQEDIQSASHHMLFIKYLPKFQFKRNNKITIKAFADKLLKTSR